MCAIRYAPTYCVDNNCTNCPQFCPKKGALISLGFFPPIPANPLIGLGFPKQKKNRGVFWGVPAKTAQKGRLFTVIEQSDIREGVYTETVNSGRFCYFPTVCTVKPTLQQKVGSGTTGIW